MIEEGKKAPSFSLKDQSGKTVKLSDFAGKHVVLYFYPKDNTPGCTQEACDFRDSQAKLLKKGAIVLGVSPDNEKSHVKFATKYELEFPLLVDEDHAIAEKYGAWGEKVLYGRKFMGIIRSTFLIGPDGKIKKVWPKVKVAGHVDDVLAAVRS
ncbi:MAG: thioredoxin-dependent thiol peroxidase [Myxococcaceae bacterium]